MPIYGTYILNPNKSKKPSLAPRFAASGGTHTLLDHSGSSLFFTESNGHQVHPPLLKLLMYGITEEVQLERYMLLYP